jgi:hypothetical protein
MPNTKASPAMRLHGQMARLLNGTKADKDEVTQILITFLAIQLANYEPLERLDVWDAAVDTLDEMVEVLAEEVDAQFTRN